MKCLNCNTETENNFCTIKCENRYYFLKSLGYNVYYSKNTNSYYISKQEYTPIKPIKPKKQKPIKPKLKIKKRFIKSQNKNEYQRKYFKLRRKEPLFKLRQNTSIEINQSIKRFNNVKPKYPFNIKELKIHLEKQFDKNMTWDNYGSYWNLEHKIPISWFPNEKELIKYGWNLENLTPLEKINNMQKGNKYAVVGEEIYFSYEDAISEFMQLIS